MRELSIFADESGDKTDHTRYFILTLVIHDQDDPIADKVSVYETSLGRVDLPNIAFHSEPLLNGHREYENLSLGQRKQLLSAFAALVRYLPIRYKMFVYRHNEFEEVTKLAARMKRDISGMFFDHPTAVPFAQFNLTKHRIDDGW